MHHGTVTPFPSAPHFLCSLCFDKVHYLKSSSRIFLGGYFWALSHKRLLHFFAFLFKSIFDGSSFIFEDFFVSWDSIRNY